MRPWPAPVFAFYSPIIILIGTKGVVKWVGWPQIEDFAQDVEAFREKFGLKKFGLIGLSWGRADALKYITMYPKHLSRVVFLGPLSPSFALYQERLKHLDSLKTDKEREEEKQIREKMRTAPDSEEPKLCGELFEASHREYVGDTTHLKRSRQDPFAYPVAGLRNAQFVFQAGLASLGQWDFRPDMKKVKVPRWCSKEQRHTFRWKRRENGSSLFPMLAFC